MYEKRLTNRELKTVADSSRFFYSDTEISELLPALMPISDSLIETAHYDHNQASLQHYYVRFYPEYDQCLEIARMLKPDYFDLPDTRPVLPEVREKWELEKFLVDYYPFPFDFLYDNWQEDANIVVQKNGARNKQVEFIAHCC